MAFCCRIFTPARPDYPAASVRDFCPGAYIADRPWNYARCDQRRKSGRFRGHERGNCDAPFARRDRSGVPVCRGEGGIPPFRRSRAFRQSRDHTRLRSDRLAKPRNQGFESASLQRRVASEPVFAKAAPPARRLTGLHRRAARRSRQNDRVDPAGGLRDPMGPGRGEPLHRRTTRPR